MKNLREVFLKFKDVKDKGVTFVTSVKEEKYVTYDEIFKNSLKIGNNLIKNNINKNSKIIFQIDSNELFIYYFWACIAYEYYAVPLEIAKNIESRNKLINVASSLCDAVIITTKTQKEKLEKIKDKLNCRIVVADEFGEVEDNISINQEEDLSEKIAFVQFSSGSTGNPKGVMLSHKNLMTNIDAIKTGINLKEDDIGLSWLPLTHDMGLIGFHLTPASYLVNHIIIDTKVFSLKPYIWLELLDKYKGTITCSPNFGYVHLMNYLEKKKVDKSYNLSNVRVIFNGAERISYEIIDEFINKMKKYKLKENVIFPVYGLAEASLAAAFPKVNTPVKYLSINKKKMFLGDKVTPLEGGTKFVCEGESVKGILVKVLDEEKKPVENVVGRVYISGKSVAKKFLIDNNEVPSLDSEGRLFTGDIGFIYNKEVYIIGRESELIINGKNYFCTDAEEYINKKINYKYQFVLIPIGKDARDKYGIVIFLKHKFDENIVEIFKNIRKDVCDKTSIRYDGIVFIDSIPKTTSGKIKRFEIIQKYNSGDYGNIVSLRNRSIDKYEYNKFQIDILNIFEKAYNERPDINEDVSYLFTESITNVAFLYYVEEFYKIKIDIDAFNGLKTVKEICSKVKMYL